LLYPVISLLILGLQIGILMRIIIPATAVVLAMKFISFY